MGSTPTAGTLFEMKIIIAVLLFLASTAAAGTRKCADGGPPRLTGDLFAPAGCSSATLASATLPVPPVNPRQVSLAGLDGAYEGSAVQGLGRYQVRVELKSGWFGRAEATLRLIELQFHTLSVSTVKLTPAKGDGRFDAVLTAAILPGSELKGEAQAGTVAASTSTPRGIIAEGRQFDVRFANGAQYRLRFAPSGKSAYRAQVWWAVPGAPDRSFETELTPVPAQP